jgi:hypothetical protein
MPFRFKSPLWLEEGGHQYLSAEAEQALGKALSAARVELSKVWLPMGLAAIGLIGALTGLVAALRR